MCGFDPAPGDGTHDLNYAIYRATVHVHSLGSGEPFLVNTFWGWFLPLPIPSNGAAKHGSAAPISPRTDVAAMRQNQSPVLGLKPLPLHRVRAEILRISGVAVACSALSRLGCNAVCIFLSLLFHYFQMPVLETLLHFELL